MDGLKKCLLARITRKDRGLMNNLSKSDHLKVLFLFVLFSIIFTYPLVINMNNIAERDNYQVLFAFWWFKKALFSFQNPYFTDYIFYPEGVSLALHASVFSNFLITLPVSLLFNANVALNTAYLLVLILSGYTAFLLAFELTASREASLIAGLIFAFNPFYHERCLNIVALQWIPIYFLMFKRAFERDTYKWAIFAGLFLGLIILTDQHQTVSVLLITSMAIPVLFFQCNPNCRKIVINLSIIIAVTLFISGWYLYQAIQLIVNNPETTKIGVMEHGGANMFSGDLAVYFVPPVWHPLWGKLFSAYAPKLENVSFLGYLPLLMALIGGVKFFKKDVVKYIIAMTLFFWILSLGTYLHIKGEWIWEGNSYALPFLYLSRLPVIGDIRTPCRFQMITILGISLLAAYGVLWLLERQRMGGINRAVWLPIAISSIILIEFMAPPPSTVLRGTSIPALYEDMSGDKDDYAVLELPLARWSAIHRNGSGDPAVLMYFQVVHGKRILNGHIARVPLYALDFKDPVLDLFSEISTQDNFRIGRKLGEPTKTEVLEVRKMALELSKGSKEFFTRYDIRYIVLHAPISWNNTLSRAFVEAFTGKSLIDVPNDNIAYIKVQ